jgi:hypothetical protein
MGERQVAARSAGSEPRMAAAGSLNVVDQGGDSGGAVNSS